MPEPEDILDNYWPVVEAVREMREFYLPKGGTPKICPDPAAPPIIALNKAEKRMNIRRVNRENEAEKAEEDIKSSQEHG